MQLEVTSGDQRRQVMWLVLGVSAPVLIEGTFLFAAAGSPLNEVTMTLILAVLSLMLPISTAFALIAPRSVDIHVLIRDASVLAVMATLTVAVYGGIEAVFQMLAGQLPPKGVRGLLVTSIATGFHPVMTRVRASTDEMLFGGRVDPVDTLTRLATQLTTGSAPEEWLHTLRAALAAQGVILRRGENVVASSGHLEGAAIEITPLRAGAEHVGDLIIGLPADRPHLAPTTQTLLSLVAAPLAQALHAVRLSEQLKASQRKVVTALEDERRRMRRDLHDGLGPTLAGIAFSADAAYNLIRAEPDQASDVLRQLRTDASEAIAEVRRIVYGLRPTALDELGLVAAIQQRITHLRGVDGLVMTID
jgi:signal transduction histidine kinase